VIVACGDHEVDFPKVGGDPVVVVCDDGGCGITSIGNGVHIVSPVDKAIARLNPRHQADHRSLVIGKSALSWGGY